MSCGRRAGRKRRHRKIRAALRHNSLRGLRQKQIVVYDEWTVIDLDHQVLVMVVLKQVAGNTRTLRHPIQPQAAAESVDAVMADLHIDAA